jgi:Tol biopolymer transport system component
LSAAPQRLSTGLNAHTLALSSDGRTLTFSTLSREANIWMLSLRPGEAITDDAAVQVTAGNQVIERVALSSDGRWLLFDSDRRGNADIYRLRLDQPGAEPEQLTSDSANDYAAAFSPDGRSIVFHSLRSGNRDLWLMSSDGTNQRQLTTSLTQEYAGTWSPDGRSIAFYADSASTIWLAVISRGANGEWGPARLLVPRAPGLAAWAPDGRTVATIYDGSVATVPVDGGEPTRLYQLPLGFQSSRGVRWSDDGRSIYYRLRETDGRLSLILLPVNGGPPVTLVRQHDASRTGPRSDWTTNGRQFFFTIHHYEGDISTVEIK